jgi:hypothetical protein
MYTYGTLKNGQEFMKAEGQPTKAVLTQTFCIHSVSFTIFTMPFLPKPPADNHGSHGELVRVPQFGKP